MPDDFNPEANNAVLSLAVQADGKILAGGVFTNLAGHRRDYAARLYPEGTLDMGLDPGANGRVLAWAVQPDGKILAGGEFSMLGGQTRTHIARLNADGTLDLEFNPNLDTPVQAVGVQADGKIVVGRSFYFGGEPSRRGIARLNADGSPEIEFDPGANGGVQCLALQADGKILIGGFFRMLGAHTRHRIARLNADGSPELEFNPGADGAVRCLALQADGKILVGGDFTMIGAQPRHRIARLNADGTLDPAFAPHVQGLSYALYVASLAVQADGKIFIGGSFTKVDNTFRKDLALLHPDGTVESRFNPRPTNTVTSLALQKDGRLLVGGYFISLGGVPRQYIGRLHNNDPAMQEFAYDAGELTWLRDGSSPEVWRTTFEHSSDGVEWASLGAGTRIPGGWRLPAASFPQGTIRARGFVAGHAASWWVEDYFGSLVFITHPSSQTNQAVGTTTFRAMAGGTGLVSYQWLKDGVALTNGSQVAGATTDTLTLSNLFRSDAAGYSVVALDSLTSLTSRVAQLTVLDPFISVHPLSQSGERASSITLVTAVEGTPPSSYQWWFNGSILENATEPTLVLSNLAPNHSGEYFVVATNQHGTASSSTARLTVNPPLFDPSFKSELGPFMIGDWMAVQADGKVLVGGFISDFIARLSKSGRLDTDFTPSIGGYLDSAAVQPDGKILVAGGFSGVNRQPRRGIARLNRDGTLDLEFDPRPSGHGFVVALEPEGKILIGGNFTALGEIPRKYLARLHQNGTVDDTFNPQLNAVVWLIAIQSNGSILVYSGRILRFDRNGRADLDFNPPMLSVYGMAVQPDGKILVSSWPGSTPALARLLPDGQLDPEFNPGAVGWVSTLAMQADGKLLVGGGFSTMGVQTRNHLARLNTDGTLDDEFNPGADETVTALAVQPDGKILAYGGFAILDGQPAQRLGRLENTEPATQSLNYDGSTITWYRGGTSPEIAYGAFESSSDGANWAFVGLGDRIPGGWQLSGVALAPGEILRARGSVISFGANWFVESFWQPAASLRVVLGRAVASNGQPACMPVHAVASDILTNLTFTLSFPHSGFADLTAGLADPESATASIVSINPTQAVVTLATRPGHYWHGHQHLADLCFTLEEVQQTQIAPVWIGDVIAMRSDGVFVADTEGQAGQVVMLDDAPLLEALLADDGIIQLVLYAQPGTTNLLQFTTSLDTGPAGWQTAMQWPMLGTNRTQVSLNATNASMFFRAIRP